VLRGHVGVYPQFAPGSTWRKSLHATEATSATLGPLRTIRARLTSVVNVSGHSVVEAAEASGAASTAWFICFKVNLTTDS